MSIKLLGKAPIAFYLGKLVVWEVVAGCGTFKPSFQMRVVERVRRNGSLRLENYKLQLVFNDLHKNVLARNSRFKKKKKNIGKLFGL